jgi:glycosyltransferase involved in cell wall biosynthesis
MSARICFVGMDSYPVIAEDDEGTYLGGESVQQVLLAKAFRDAGHVVSLVTRDDGVGEPDEEFGGIRVLKTFRKDTGLPVLRFLHPRMTSVWRGLIAADADIYYQSCAGALTGVVAAFCRRHKRRLIFRVAHDSDCVRGRQLIRFWRDRKLFEWGLQQADLIAAQTRAQVQMLREQYGLQSTAINMTVEIPEDLGREGRPIDVLWVNNMRPFKRPEFAIRVASDLPQLRFVMIGGPCPGHQDYYEQVRRKAAHVPNLDFVGPVPYSRVNEYFWKAKLFLNTSEVEGFPNSFLQAWVRGVPVVSFFDPDELIGNHQLGIQVASLETMRMAIVRLLDDGEALRAMGDRARRFAREQFSPDAAVARYLAALDGGSRVGREDATGA